MNNGDISRGRGRGSWNQVDNEHKELRRPHGQLVAENSNNATGTQSKLSAEAKEWFPPNYVGQTENHNSYQNNDNLGYGASRGARFSVQDRLRVNQNRDAYNLQDINNSLPDERTDHELRESIVNLINVMCEVTFSPGRFDNLCGPLVDQFASTLHDPTYTRPLVDAIVNQSVCEQNFRYNGARLCSMYDSLAPPEESVFRNCLIERCFADENKIVSGEEELEENRRGFAMFLAEIYTQLEDPQGGRIKLLGESLCKVLLYLLDTGDAESIKSVCQLLKLSGIALDADCPLGMHAAFERLQRLTHLPLVNNVIQLRNNRWGVLEGGNRRNSDPESNGPSPASAAPAPTDHVYLTDGLTLTEEESDFLERHLPNSNVGPEELEDVVPEELDMDAWEPGMDPEMQASFMEFLKMSNQIKR